MEFLEVPISVEKVHAGSRLDAFLAARLHGYSRQKVQSLIAEGRVLWKGRPAKASSRVAQGDPVVLLVPKREDPPARHERLEALYEDGAILAVNKPGDVLSHPTDKIANNSATAILAKQRPGEKLCLVHRLDRETSGVLLFAKSSELAADLGKQFFERATQKEYWALVLGRVDFETKTVDKPLGYDTHEVRMRQRVMEEGEGYPAKTEFRALKTGERFSLVSALPKSGRLHQIRVHLAYLGHPVAGDKIYVGEGEHFLKMWKGELDGAALEFPRQMLHARRLEIRHPVTDKMIAIEAPLPADFEAALARI
jgi:23S rRNA pseudouridine1911/1915/1917 synthase